MRCCVQNCTNDDLKKTNKSKGITFHKLPKDEIDYAAWYRILDEAGARLSRSLVVCSDHFKPEDFVTRPNQRRVKSGVVPSLMLTVIQDEIEVCRVCLASDVRMYDMKSFKYSEMFHNITGILACDKIEGIIHHICWECASRLTAAAAFRDKALYSDALLKDLAHINKLDIATLKQNHETLKSTLTAHAEATIHIEGVFSVSENKQTEMVLNDEEKKTEIRVAEDVNQMNFEEPWIYVPVKCEVELDPIADEASSDEEMQSAADEVPVKSDEEPVNNADKEPVKKGKKKVKSKAEPKFRLTERMKEKIIAMKKGGQSIKAISRDTGISIQTIFRWWTRYRKCGYTYRKSTKVETGQVDSKPDIYHHYIQTEPGKELGACSDIVKHRLCEAGFRHILMKKPELNVKTEQIISENKKKHDDLKQRIIALKQEGIATNRVAYLLNTSRITVRKWWDRWCNEGHMQNMKGPSGRKKKTTPEEDQLLIQRVMQEQTVHTPSLAKELGISLASLRRRLKAAGFQHMERKAYVPLKAGRSQKVDEELKQQIISMKLNGVSVTDIANKFRVPRTTIYQWCQRWCRENGVKTTSHMNNTSTFTEQEQSYTEEATVEKNSETPVILSAKKSLWQKLPDMESLLSPKNESAQF